MRCGNNTPRSEWTPEERQIVKDFEKYLELSYMRDSGEALARQAAEWLTEYVRRNDARARKRPEDPRASDT